MQRLTFLFDDEHNYSDLISFQLAGSGQLEFEEFVTLAAGFLVEDEVEDVAAMQEELKEAFRLYDKEGNLDQGFVIS